jgi:uroporphyrinogen III methyltransferase/synthase
MVTFASGSAVENFLALKPSLTPEVKIASLGPITSRALREAGLRVDVQAPGADLDQFAAAIVNFYSTESSG